MTQEEFDNFVDMFAGKGWKEFITSVNDMEEKLTKAAVDAAPTNDQWQFMRGQLSQLRAISGYETFIKAAFELDKEEEKEDE